MTSSNQLAMIHLPDAVLPDRAWVVTRWGCVVAHGILALVDQSPCEVPVEHVVVLHDHDDLWVSFVPAIGADDIVHDLPTANCCQHGATTNRGYSVAI